MSTTTDRNDPELTRGIDEAPVEQAKKYIVLSPEELAKGFIRPVRYQYTHSACGAVTHMNERIAETYARDPQFYGATYCIACRMHRPVGEAGEFVWEDGTKVGT